jgi:hypothetical protein
MLSQARRFRFQGPYHDGRTQDQGFKLRRLHQLTHTQREDDNEWRFKSRRRHQETHTQGKIERFFQTFELCHPRFDDPTQFREYYNRKPHRTPHSSLPEVRCS